VNYDPAAIRKMASLLGSLANVAVFLYGLAAVGTFIGTAIAGKALGGAGGGFAVGAGLLYALLIMGAGYLLALGLRVGAQLMLAVVQIEANTAGVSAVSTAAASNRISVPPMDLESPLPTASEEVAPVAVPDEVKILFTNLRSAYDRWLDTSADDDTFTYDEDVSDARDSFLSSLAALKDGCAGQPESVRTAAASACLRRFSEMQGDGEFDRMVVALDGRA